MHALQLIIDSVNAAFSSFGTNDVPEISNLPLDSTSADAPCLVVLQNFGKGFEVNVILLRIQFFSAGGVGKALALASRPAAARMPRCSAAS